MNVEAGILIMDSEAIKKLPGKISVGAPHMEVPLWTIGNSKGLPDWVKSFKNIGDFYKYLEQHEQTPIPDSVKGEGVGKIKKRLNKIEQGRLAEQDEQQKQYMEWQEGWSWPKKRKPRVFCYCTAFSSVMKWQAQGLMKGFEKIGCKTKYMEENDSWSRIQYGITPDPGKPQEIMALPLIRALNKFKPDLIICINWYRNPNIHGTKIPFFTWVQDRLRNLNAEAGNAIKDNDFLGMICRKFIDKWMMSQFPEKQMAVVPAGYDEDVFYPPEDGAKREGIVYVEQNGATTAMDMWNSLRANYAGMIKQDARMGEALDVFCARAIALFEMGIDLFEYEYEMIMADVCGEMGYSFPPVMRRDFLWRFSHDVGNRVIRQRPLECLVKAGAPLKLLGNNWAKHPLLSGADGGTASPIETVAEAYRSASIVLNLQHETTMIHRGVEGLACGAHMVVKQIDTDFEPIQEHVAVNLYRRSQDIVPLTQKLLQTPHLTREQTNIDNYSFTAHATNILGWIDERMRSGQKEKN